MAVIVVIGLFPSTGLFLWALPWPAWFGLVWACFGSYHWLQAVRIGSRNAELERDVHYLREAVTSRDQIIRQLQTAVDTGHLPDPVARAAAALTGEAPAYYPGMWSEAAQEAEEDARRREEEREHLDAEVAAEGARCRNAWQFLHYRQALAEKRDEIMVIVEAAIQTWRREGHRLDHDDPQLQALYITRQIMRAAKDGEMLRPGGVAGEMIDDVSEDAEALRRSRLFAETVESEKELLHAEELAARHAEYLNVGGHDDRRAVR